MDKKRFLKSIKIIFVGAIIAFSFLLWYKQFSYRTISYYDLEPEIEEEKCGITLTYDGENYEYTESRSFIAQWYKTPYYLISLTNETDESVVYQISDVSSSIDSAQRDESILNPGEEITLPYQYSQSIDLYTKNGNAGDISTLITNREYMNLYKSIVKAVLFMSVGLVILVAAIKCWSAGEKFKNYVNKVFSFLMLSLFVLAVLSCYVHFYSYIYSCALYGIILLGAMKILLAESEEHAVCESEHERNINNYIVVGIGCLSFVLILFSQMLNATGGFFQKFSASRHMGIIDYFLVVLIYIILFLGINFIIQKQQKNLFPIYWVFSTNEVFFSVVLVELTLLIELGNWRYSLSLFRGILFGIITFVLFFLYLKGKKFTERKFNSYVYYALVIFAGVGVVLNNVQINYWGNGFNDVYHTSWYYASLYEIGFHLPYPGGIQDAYGHFGLFYKIPMDLFGHSTLVIGCVTAFFAVVMYVALMGTVHHVIHNNIYRGVAAIAFLVSFTLNFAYPMNVPHRILFPALLLFLITNNQEHVLTKKKQILGYILCFFSILWSTETGAMCSVVFALYVSLKKAYEKEKNIGSCILYFMAHIPVIIFNFLLCYITVLIYNVSVGGNYTDYSFAGFLGVLLDKENMLAGQMNVFYFENEQWIYYLVLFLTMASYGIVTYRKNRGGGKRKCEGINWITISAMGLCFMVIILSRPEDYTLVLPYVILLSIMALEKMQSWLISFPIREKKRILPIESVKLLMIVAGIIFMTNIFVRIPDTMRQISANLTKYHRFNYQVIQKDEVILKELPLNQIYAVGNGINMLYLDMGIPLENGFGGLTPEGSGTVIEELKVTDKPYILTDLDLTGDNYIKIEDFYIDKYVYTLYFNRNAQ